MQIFRFHKRMDENTSAGCLTKLRLSAPVLLKRLNLESLLMTLLLLPFVVEVWLAALAPAWGMGRQVAAI
jgi:hypothetical protein